MLKLNLSDCKISIIALKTILFRKKYINYFFLFVTYFTIIFCFIVEKKTVGIKFSKQNYLSTKDKNTLLHFTGTYRYENITIIYSNDNILWFSNKCRKSTKINNTIVFEYYNNY